MKLRFWFALATACLAGNGATTIFHNGRIHDLGQRRSVYHWIAVTDGKVTAKGRGRSYRSRRADRKVNLRRKHVLPGLTDSHVHLAEIGAEHFEVDLRGTRSAEEAAARVKTFLAGPGTATTGAIHGVGWDQSDWPGQKYPHRRLLDEVSSTRPILLNRIDGHAAWVNTFALKKAEIFEYPLQSEGGKIELDENGVPTGILIDTAMDALEDLGEDPSDEELETHFKIAVQKALSLGITGAHDAGATPAQIEAIRRLLKTKAVRFRFNEMLLADNPAELAAYLEKGIEVDAEDGQLTVRSVKLFADGAMGSRGAAFDEPYADDPKNFGLLRMTPEEMEKTIRLIDAKGFQVAVHAIGDRANREVLDAFEKVMGAGVALKRPRIEHAQALNSQDITRLGKRGVIASMQPLHCTSDMKWVVDRIGEVRARTAYAWNSLKGAGARLAFGSDAPVDDLNPWRGLFASVRRQTLAYEPKGGFFPKERIPLRAALAAYTKGAAYAAFAEKTQGSLDTGHYADFIVVPSDPFRLTPKKLAEMKVEATYVGGELAWSRAAKTALP